MKRISLWCLTAIVLSLVAAPAFAAITGTSHQTGAGSGGCGACHIPHGGTTSSRLWPVNPSTTGLTFRGQTSTLCASCHYSSGAYSSTMGGAFSDNYAYGIYGHGVRMANNLGANGPEGTTATAVFSGLPYADQSGGFFECTTCHDVHTDTNRPFLRADMDVLCARCHTLRNFQAAGDSSGTGATFGAWGGTARMSAANPGSHPVGTDITGEMHTPADSPILWSARVTAPKSATVSGWVLGGHRSSGATGGATCNSCHAVHGSQWDTTSGAAPGGWVDNAPTVNMLVIGQNTGANEGLTGRSIANGDGGANNPLCEYCHNNSWNPGASSFSHPADAQVGAWAAPFTIPAGWPRVVTTNKAMCESCHSPHTAATDANRATIDASGRGYILRYGQDTICQQCHSNRITKHHPVGYDVATALTGAASYLRTGGLAAGNIMGCGTCHSGGGNAAHNWAAAGGAGLGLNPNWRPSNNARDNTMATDRFAASPNTVTTANVSATCVDCHLAVSQAVAAGSFSPTLHNPTGKGINATDNAEYTHLGEGSHMLGTFTATYLNANKTIRALDGITGSATFNPFTGAWTTAIFSATASNNGWSRFGGTSAAPILVCESCHDLEMDKNVGNHMLLADYYEGESGTKHASYFCEGCHGEPAGTHPMYQDPIARTGAQLATSWGTLPAWIRTGAPKATQNTSLPNGVAGTGTWLAGAAGTGSMSCDSCHQPHDAAGASLSIDTPAANVTGGTTVNYTNANYFGGAAISARTSKTSSVGTLPDTSNYCDTCHAYK